MLDHTENLGDSLTFTEAGHICQLIAAHSVDWERKSLVGTNYIG